MKKKILIVDFDIPEHRLFMEIFKQVNQDLVIELAYDPTSTFRLLKRAMRSFLPTVIAIHHHVLQLNALKLLNDLNKIGLYQPIMKIIWGEPREEQFRDLCLQAGALDYFVKPERPSEVKMAVRQILMAANLLPGVTQE